MNPPDPLGRARAGVHISQSIVKLFGRKTDVESPNMKRQLQSRLSSDCRKEKRLVTACEYEATTGSTREADIWKLRGALHIP